jgi:hypothetical protein
MVKHVAALTAILALAGGPPSPAALEGRSGPAVTWHAGLGQVVLFGGGTGRADNPFPRSLWGWTGERWTLLTADGPPGRSTADLAVDPRRNVLVLHGGRDRDAAGKSRILNDTWEWKDGAWTKVADNGLPSRIHFVLGYDAARRAVLLFGGIGSNGQWYRDTWAWDGKAWTTTSIAPIPEGIIGRAMVTDTGAIVLMVAEPDANGCGALHRPTLYELRGDAWASPGEPGPCFGPSSPAPIAWTPDGVLLYSGWNGPDANSPLVSTLWSRGAWRTIEGAPSRRRSGNSAYDATRRRVVHVGGETDAGPINETWESDAARWTRVSPRPE